MPSQQERRLPARLLVLCLLSFGLGACSVSPADVVGSGGSTSSGGTTASGGSGGSGGKGGSEASGGSVTSGGSKGSGGVQDTGGTVGSGGSKASGGNSAGGAATGGSSVVVPGTGGSGKDAGTGGSAPGGATTTKPGTGGLGRGGAGGLGRAGATGSGGAGVPGTGGSTATAGSTGTGKGSPGCGSTSPLKTGNFTESIGGTNRKWMLDVPSNYDANKPYRLIFVWHPLSGSGSQIVSGGFNGLKSLANNTAVFATADGLNGSNGEASGTGWWNANGGDMKLVQAMLDKINAGLCIDQERIFSTGFSFGGMMSYTLPFEFDVIRAVAPCSGDLQVIPHNSTYTGPVPIMAFHGNNDTVVSLTRGKAARDEYLTRNKCGTQTQKVDPSPCVQYQDCAAPTIWCEFSGGHNTTSDEPGAIWQFFSQF